TPGGVLNLGKNWSTTALADSDPWHPVPGTVTGWANMIKGSTAPMDANTFIPLSGSAIVDKGQAALAAVTSFPVQYQFDMATFSGKTRPQFGTASDIGAVERLSN
ncbi:MAG: hypothetical protein HYX44_10270, partial [Aquabacterium sp.]|nr:hypothetical protein [Aquabacterium sp.]